MLSGFVARIDEVPGGDFPSYTDKVVTNILGPLTNARTHLELVSLINTGGFLYRSMYTLYKVDHCG